MSVGSIVLLPVDVVISLLTPDRLRLQEDIFFLLHEHLLRKVPIFDGCHDEFVRALARQLRAEVLIAGDYAFKMNEMGKSMYFLQTGFMQVQLCASRMFTACHRM